MGFFCLVVCGFFCLFFFFYLVWWWFFCFCFCGFFGKFLFSPRHKVITFCICFWGRKQIGSVGCISLSGLQLVVILLVNSCIFPGSITISSQGPQRSRLTLQIFFTNHLIQLGCQDLALKLARNICLVVP